jgi:hypothetical protein
MALSATLTTIGLPPRSAKGLLGKRVDARRAGIMTVKDMGELQNSDDNGKVR